jgi:hypothetical protein
MAMLAAYRVAYLLDIARLAEPSTARRAAAVFQERIFDGLLFRTDIPVGGRQGRRRFRHRLRTLPR